MRDSNEVVTIAGVVNPCQGDSLQQDGCWVVRSGSIMIKVWNCLALIADKCATPRRESPLRESPIHVRETPHTKMRVGAGSCEYGVLRFVFFQRRVLVSMLLLTLVLQAPVEGMLRCSGLCAGGKCAVIHGMGGDEVKFN